MGKSDVEANIRPEDLDKFCFCCQRLQPTPIGEEAVCTQCEKDQKWYETGSHSVHEAIRISARDIKHVVKILPHKQGWVVNGEKIEV